VDKHGEKDLLLNGEVGRVADDGEHVLGVEVEVVFPGVFLNLHEFLSRVLDVSLVYFVGQLLEGVAHSTDEWPKENALMGHFLTWLRGQDWKGGT
jgi:hypothetical protein